MSNEKQAFVELKRIGAPVFAGGYDGGLFRISAEDNDDVLWADYYVDCGYVSEAIEAILDKHGLFCEWCNAGVLDVFEA